MLKDITGIKISGAGFSGSAELQLLDPKDGKKTKTLKGTILYGRNGSGKSTIAKSFKKIINGGYSHITQANVIDNDANVTFLTEDEKSRIFVFDEEFVDRNIKLQEVGLNTIVMLGQQADLTNQIENAQKELDIATKEYDELSENLKEYEDRQNQKSPQYYIDKMRFELQGDDNWAGRDKVIKGGRQNTGVRDDTYKQFLSLSPQKKRDELIILFNNKLKELRQAQSGDAVISNKVPMTEMQYNDTSVAELLAKKIQQPVLSEREKYLLALVQKGKSDRLVEMAGVFGKESTKECPYCMQPLDEDYKKELFDSIQKVISKAVEDHQKALQKLIVDELRLDLSPYEKLNDKNFLCLDLIERINQMIKENNQRLKSKIDDPYSPIEIEATTIGTCLKELTKSLEALEEARETFNKKVQATAPIKKELIKINNEIAYFDVEELAKQYETQKQAYGIEKQKQNDKRSIYLQKKNLVDELVAKRKNVQVALTVINNSLKYIFFSEDRLRIEYQNEAYVLLANGHAVKPSEISQGERNIIALCYFFANIMQNKEVSTAYGKEYLLIIDDPISSFDIENKVGIMSFLKYQLGQFLLGNVDTRAIIMTHDLLTFYDLNKIYEELIESCNNKYQGQQLKFNRFELAQQNLKVFEYKNRQEYTELIKIVYNYALGNANNYEIIIGNILRQILEAFSTFQYKKGIEKVSTDPYILETLPEEEYRSYFNNLMYRLVLHGGSHREEQVKAMDDMNFFSVISSSDKQRTAKDVLCFIYLLNKKHIIAHLKECGNAVDTNINQWCNEIKSRAAV
ncbi:AAA family ATPase [Lachnospiraceae bacterium 47-T17]